MYEDPYDSAVPAWYKTLKKNITSKWAWQKFERDKANDSHIINPRETKKDYDWLTEITGETIDLCFILFNASK